MIYKLNFLFLFNSGKVSSSLDLPAEDWNSVVTTNLTGAWLVSKYVGVHMRESGRGGSIINISSVSGLNRAQMRGGVAYSSSKAGMDSMTRVYIYIYIFHLILSMLLYRFSPGHMRI